MSEQTSAADLADTVRTYMDENAMGDWSLESEESARIALDALLSRCEQAERELDDAERQRDNNETLRRAAVERAVQAERDRDGWRETAAATARLENEQADRAESAEARVAELEETQIRWESDRNSIALEAADLRARVAELEAALRAADYLIDRYMAVEYGKPVRDLDEALFAYTSSRAALAAAPADTEGGAA